METFTINKSGIITIDGIDYQLLAIPKDGNNFWTDALVIEFANTLYVDVIADDKFIEAFKKSKQKING